MSRSGRSSTNTGFLREDRCVLTVAFFSVLAVCLFPSSGHAKYSGGTGEPNSPYLISDANDMNAIGADANDWDKHFRLTADIDLAGFDGRDGRPSFNVIGNSTTKFTGVFDGNARNISGFRFDGASYVGLFRYVGGADAEIKDLGLIGVHVHGSGHVAALAASLSGGALISNCYVEGGYVGGSSVVIAGLVSANSGTIRHCHVTAKVAGYFNTVGGLVGSNSGSIRNCYASGDVDGQLYQTGGLVGDNSGTIEYSYATGNVEADGWFVGGLVGENSGSVECCYATGDCEGLSQVGGLCGTNETGATVAYSFATGWILSRQIDVGGLVGSNSGSISNCYALGDVGVMFSGVGGLVGKNLSLASVEKCYSTGRIVYAQSGYGGLVGMGPGSVVKNSFWDKQTSGREYSAGGLRTMTSSMKRSGQYLYYGWDFVGEDENGTEDIWTICEKTNYPRFVWQVPPGDLVCPDGVNFKDFGFFAARWMNANCRNSNDCDSADLDGSGEVGTADLEIFVDDWLAAIL